MKTKEQILNQLGYTVDGTDEHKKYMFDLIISQAMDEWLKENLANGVERSSEKCHIQNVSNMFCEICMEWVGDTDKCLKCGNTDLKWDATY